MIQPVFMLEVDSILYRLRFNFFKTKVVYSWERSPLHYGEISVPRDQLSGEIAEAKVFGHDVSRHLLPLLISLLGALWLTVDFESFWWLLLAIPLYIIALLQLALIVIKLRSERWVYLLKKDGSTAFSFCVDYLKNMDESEFLEKYKQYVSFGTVSEQAAEKLNETP